MLIGKTKTVIAPQKKTHKHKWGKTERKIPGALLYFNGCEGCGKLLAYDLIIISPQRFHGHSEYESRSY